MSVVPPLEHFTLMLVVKVGCILSCPDKVLTLVPPLQFLVVKVS